MSARRLCAATRIASSAFVLMMIVAGPLVSGGSALAQASEPYEFLKGQIRMARIDTATGQVSTVQMNGDGGWKPIGPAPSSEGKLAHAGRYGLLKLQPQRVPVRPGSPSTISEPVIRFDRATGRAWAGDISMFTHWREFGGEDLPPPAPSSSSGGETAGRAEYGLKVLSKKTLDDAGGLSPADVAIFIQAINKPDLESDVRVWATLQLGAVDPDLSVPPLLEALRSDDPRIVAAAVQALAQTGVASVVPQILKLENHPDPAVRAAVKAAVTRVD